MKDRRLILHHYDFSNFSEKIRLVLALKGIPWQSVKIPSHLPKPDYLPLTAGYRRTPALQISSDVYCDTQSIVSILDSLEPTPPLYPSNLSHSDRAKCKMIEDWAETSFIRPIALYISGLHARQFSEEFHNDRADLHGKPIPTVAKVELSAEKYKTQVEIYLNWLDQLLTNGNNYLLGKEVSITDLVLFEGPWFLKKISGNEQFLDRYPSMRPWFRKIESIEKPNVTDIRSQDAIDLAYETYPVPIEEAIENGKKFKLGELVKISAIGQNAMAIGELVRMDSDGISLASNTERTGSIHVHFPRLGYSVKSL